MNKFAVVIASSALLALGADAALGQVQRDRDNDGGRRQGDARTGRPDGVARDGVARDGRPQAGPRGDRYQGAPRDGRPHAAPYSGRRNDSPYDGRRGSRGPDYGYRMAPSPHYYYPYGTYAPPAMGIYVPGYVEQYPVYESPVYITQEYVYPAPPMPAPPLPPPPPTPYYRAPAIAQAAPPPPPPAPAPAPAPVLQMERYTLSASELFEFDSNELRSPQPKLDEIAAVLVNNPQIGNVQITGYTDRLGTDAYNLKLSQRRADAVKAYLVAAGVAANRLVAVGRGEADPVVQCKQTARAALIKCLEPNRRVEVAQITVERVRQQR